ncbi:MAG TPA: purine-nucleoside phosphorylase [Pyrinomonadaceae bacterium]|nr:purine-nucleoside phosphorylase [Pyrinomonadaceae bacterium]
MSRRDNSPDEPPAETTGADTVYERAQHAARTIRVRRDEDFRVAVVLGSGLGAFADSLEDPLAVSYSDIPGFARSTVAGHAGRLVLGRVASTPVAVMQGRFHYYEGYTLEEVTFPVRTLAALGVRSLVLTNAAGGLNNSFTQGCLVLISDHLNLLGTSPLRGANDERLGPRFPDMTEVYSHEFQEAAVREAHEMGLDLRRGIYAALQGPNYETPAEIRMLRLLGADAVGMSTVPEAIVARHMGLRVLGLSCITNMAAGVLDEPINHEDVIETGRRVQATLAELLRRVIPKLQ